jgi:hypothetical protein
MKREAKGSAVMLFVGMKPQWTFLLLLAFKCPPIFALLTKH